MRHLSDQQLIEIHYLDASLGTASHLGTCEQCSERLRTIAGELQRAATAGMETVEPRPDSFWQRQRVAIDRGIDRSGERRAAAPTVRWLAAAAAAAVLIAGLLTIPRFLPSRTNEPVASAAPLSSPAASSTALDVIEDISSLDDPWESEELRPFGAAVEWETWEQEHQTRNNS